jgi:hypothetical protein
MIGRMAAVLLLPVLFIASAQAAPLTLRCSGISSMPQNPKLAMGTAPKRITDFSVVVDFEHRTVSGFWTDLNGVHIPLPITSEDANSIRFSASNKSGVAHTSIDGSVDRITGAVEAIDNTMLPSGELKTTTFDLHCTPTKPLF